MRASAAGTGGACGACGNRWRNAHALDVGMHGQRARALDEEGTSDAAGHAKHDSDHFPLTWKHGTQMRKGVIQTANDHSVTCPSSRPPGAS
eukprot:1403822-Prymnesium_polylepis.1